jgi:hypothetical protein
MSVKINGSGIITGLDADGISSQPVFPGNVLQVVEAVSNDNNKTTTSTSYVSAITSASITPSGANNKIFVQWCGHCDPNSGGILYVTIYRGATNLEASGGSLARVHDVSAGRFLVNQNIIFLDSPSTTDSITYTVYFKQEGGPEVRIRDDIQRSRITLMEIAG